MPPCTTVPTTSARPGRKRLLTKGRVTTGLMPVIRASAVAYTASSTTEERLLRRSSE